ncbi:conserved hypothetical protein [Theileria orientalis strain Shintoku]|uniref:NELF-A N-terminal domain-containing protein n=1 Tax=Theileria orientalis strain Shintoku TaxID=869250 RepID=J7MCE2_THEOR|nr:conserved hypothetical protein [Theileria orientalis strain Shintoku]BAM42457.1 conserved hypothetical protein [Theileria orientalis strain Shintoku]|eukprot:XP_009692758.1 conserved hypothetical protein [Theileria orientalis strain Shintoku]
MMEQIEDPFMDTDDNIYDNDDTEYFKNITEVDLKKISDQYVEYLKLIKDNWSSCHASKMLNKNLLSRYIVLRFRQLSAPLRVRILTSFLYIKEYLRIDCQKQLVRISKFAETDANEWVRKMGKLVKPYINTGIIDLRLIDTETAFRIITFLDEKLLESGDAEYVRKSGIDEVHICNPNDFDFEHMNEIIKDDEYTLYTPRHNFDYLGETIEKRGLYSLRESYNH